MAPDATANFTDQVHCFLSPVSFDAVTFDHAVHAESQSLTVTFTAVSNPIGTLLFKFGRLNVVDPSPLP